MALLEIGNIKGKGNDRMYIDRFPRIYAAGVRTKQPHLRVIDCINEGNYSKPEYNTQNENTQFKTLEIMKTTVSKDMRNAGPFTESSQLINPPILTKFQTIVEDLKSTVYKSYWNSKVGKKIDLTFCVPPDLDINNTAFGNNTKSRDNAYDIIFPNRPISPDKNPSKCPGYQSKRNYCKSSYDPNMVNGIKINADRRGKLVKCCLTDDSIYNGTSRNKPIHRSQRNFQQRHNSELGTCLTPNENINQVPEGYAFGKLEPKDNNSAHSCLTYCELNSQRDLFYKCLAHLNTLRKCLSKRFDGSFFRKFYLQLRFEDKLLCGWLPKQLIYHSCTTKFIRFNPGLIEPLLHMWKAINGTDIEYKVFISVINFREPLPDLPKVWDISPECASFSTTYKEMIMPQESNNSIRAGIPSGRYFDTDYPVTPKGCCKADRSYLPEESDARACLSPSIFSLLGVTHRDMYAPRNPQNVKRVFDAAGEHLTEDELNAVWECATKYHPKGIVSYETFRRALNDYKEKLNNNKLANTNNKMDK